MARRANRRARIIQAFEDFRSAIGAALGSAADRTDRAVAEHAAAMFEMWLRTEGLDGAAVHPELRRGLGNPRLADAVTRVRDDQLAAFERWMSTEPERLVALVSQAAPGAAGEDPGGWLGEPGKIDGTGP